MATHDLRYTIRDLEEATWRALQKSGKAMIPYITDDCIMQFPMGMKLTADSEPSTTDILYSPAFVPWKSFELSKVDVLPVGREGAVINYLARATRPPSGPAQGREDEEEEDVEFEALCSSVWRWEGNRTFVRALQTDRMPPKLQLAPRRPYTMNAARTDACSSSSSGHF
ncbi:hypothetical protein D0869_02526 [Hortaea werneckii]|uniref:Uncharacterized protein n=1 Tax=Hortaea werneckii TaxID=91943 RepID=A0A3M6X9R5_HORWE|nr:hypothetical protein D0869_02526 [Hortaea werneckii]